MAFLESALDIATGGIGGFAMGVIKNAVSGGIDAWKEHGVKKQELQNHKEIRLAEISAQQELAKANISLAEINNNIEINKLQQEIENTNQAHFSLLEKIEIEVSNPNNSKTIDWLNFLRSGVRPILTLVGFIFYIIFNIISVWVAISHNEIAKTVQAAIENFNTLVFVMIGFWFAVKGDEMKSFASVSKSQKKNS